MESEKSPKIARIRRKQFDMVKDIVLIDVNTFSGVSIKWFCLQSAAHLVSSD